MRTRDDLTEAKEVVRVLSLYGALLFQQILALFPGRAETVRNMIARMIKQKRLFYIEDCCAVAISPEKQLDAGMVSAFWVLLDFLDQVDFHIASDFPIAISFFTEAGDAYDIISIAPGQENTMNHALWYVKGEDLPKRLVVVDNPDQIPKLNITNVAGFCTVSSDGEVSYFHID